ncbi:MAG: 50S ribosomal protein L25/general stress protein Ctc [Armatimonadota bacterium]|nr:50S ribosomal protein L25/general stress protein Ctc [Armatimonadota bacterium]
MTRLQLSARSRQSLLKSYTKKLRREGKIPATVYGKDFESKPIEIEVEELEQILKSPGGRLALIDLKVDGKTSKAHPVLIQEIQRNPITKKIIHVDFHRVSLNEPVHASVPLVLVGEAPGQKQGGILEQFTRELEVKALPEHIPSHIDVDVSKLALGESIHVGDLTVPEDIEVLGPPPDIVVATVRMPAVRVEEVAPAPEAAEEAHAAAAEEPSEKARES